MMNKMKSVKLFRGCVLVLALSLPFSACAPLAPTLAPSQDVSQIETRSAQTVVAGLTQTGPLAATQTPPPPGPTMDPNIPVAIVPSPEAGDPSATASYETAIYSGPGTDYVLYGTFPEGRSAVVLGRSENEQWWAISIPVAPTGTGWVSAEWVTVQNAEDVEVLPTPPVPPTTEMVEPGPGDPQATTLVNTYIRSGPAVNYPAYGIAFSGATARVIGKSEDGRWWVVRLNPKNVGAGYGWVESQYVQTSNTDQVQTIETPDTAISSAPETPSTRSATNVALATTTDYVNVRTGPGTNYPVLVVAPPGSTGEILGKSSDGAWWQVRVPIQYSVTGVGWVSASYVIVQNISNVPIVLAPPPPPVPETPPGVTGPVCKVESQTPANGTTFTIDTPFTVTWVLENTGEKWSDGEVDLRYLGAYNNVKMHTGGDLYDLAASVQPGKTYTFSVPMIAPFNKGTYGELWEVGSGSKTICQFYVYISVP